MTPQFPLMKVTYMVPSSTLRSSSKRLPLLSLTLDFNNGSLNLDADWQYLMQLNGHSKREWFTRSRERVQIAMNIRGNQPVDLAEITEEGLLLPLDGILNDHYGAASCTGLLVIDTVGMYSGAVNNDWDISIYLYDRQQNNMEFKVKVPLLTGATNFFEYAN
ncbi:MULTISPECIES: hypothetical protein [Niastella]|uniref:Uncharacterized protein n=1 Tax=Niastella soli TaxID=2821487 RepID=A0ABS3Z1B9_9BACT|nr:hypothetical protein [Niastella soli]MBO9203943.1 hypothetical protein [Niastella soli]